MIRPLYVLEPEELELVSELTALARYEVGRVDAALDTLGASVELARPILLSGVRFLHVAIHLIANELGLANLETDAVRVARGRDFEDGTRNYGHNKHSMFDEGTQRTD